MTAFSRQNDAGSRAGIEKNLVLVVVVILEFKGLYYWDPEILLPW